MERRKKRKIRIVRRKKMDGNFEFDEIPIKTA
jgi:hypothetical protein